MSKWIVFLYAASVFCQDVSQPTDPVQNYTTLSAPIKTEKSFIFGSVSIAPGGGVSKRKRTGSMGTAYDWKIGVTLFPFDTVTLIPVPSLDYNWMYYSRLDQEISPYLSCGLGISLAPYVPLRAGFEYKRSFIDIGAKMLLGYIPLPEMRVGFNMEF